MPSSEIMKLFRTGQLHAGKDGPVVKDKKQATAILLSTLRKEGRLR